MNDPLDRTVYPIDPWRLIELAPSGGPAADTVFSVGNGFVGLRGAREEEAAGGTCFVNGFYETWPIRYPEDAYGFARHGQTIQAAPDPVRLRLALDDEPVEAGTIIEQTRVLDLATGVLTRTTVWETPAGPVRLDASRLASFRRRGLVASRIEVTPLVAGRLRLCHSLTSGTAGAPADDGLDPRRGTVLGADAVETRLCQADEGRLALGLRTARAGRGLAVVSADRLDRAAAAEATASDDRAEAVWRLELGAGEAVVLTSLAWYESGEAESPELVGRAGRAVDEALAAGWAGLLAEQKAWLDDFWTRADVVVPDAPLQQAVRWSLFQAIQATARADGAGVAAKGVTGAGYDGHYFWDMETYVVPFLACVAPSVARSALAFRHATLPQARDRAAELGLAGALFPWRTIDGREASAFFEAGTAQYHIDADIARALTHYVAMTGDTTVLDEGGADVLFETARMWASLGFWGDDGQFHWHRVTGPDEYTAMVDDNVYTNVMARANLRAAAAVARRAPESRREAREWLRIADGVCVPYDSTLGVHPQDSGFLRRQRWDPADIPPENFPLLLHYHPLAIYRRQILKQADVVLAQIMCGDDFTPEQKRANFDYYDPLTTGDSTLSAVPQAIAAAESGRLELAGEYLRRAVFADLADLHHNTADGVHVAVAAGVWSAVVAGFGGLRETDGRLRLAPRLAADWDELKFSLLWHGTRLDVTVTKGQTTLAATGTTPVPLTVWDRSVVVQPGQPLSVRWDRDEGR